MYCAFNGNAYTLIVRNNGVRLPASLDWAKIKSLGLRLPRMLGQHPLRGEIFVDATNGTCFMVQFSPGKGRISL